MYKTLLIFDNYELLTEIQNLHIWGKSSEFEISAVLRDGLSAYQKLKNNRYDLVISEIRITGMDGLMLLRRVKSEGLCSHFVLCSEFLEFNYARQGIILGAFDYFVRPFDETLFFSMFSRIKNETYGNKAEEICYREEMQEYFEKRDKEIYSYVEKIVNRLYEKNEDILSADKEIKRIFDNVISEIFDKYEWLDLYFEQEDFKRYESIYEGNHSSYKKHYGDMICRLFDEFCELMPDTGNEKINQVILYILNNPESDLKQKTISVQFYLNNSYLSTIFMAHTHILFGDYLTGIKLKRAVWLLKNTNLKILDIADRLGYKDVGYFSRLFKKRYHVTPSEFRTTDDWDYQI